MSSSIGRIQLSNIDGRARTPRFIQNQLHALHTSLLQNAPEIRQAIVASSHHTAAEVGVEFYLAVSTVKDQYTSINFDRILEEEYSVANGKDVPERRVAAGIVYIVPASHTLFYSTIAPLAAAIAAGNCVVLELSPTLSEINSILRKILPAALDADTFTVLDSELHDTSFLDSCIQVLPTPSRSKIPTANVLISPSESRVVGIVDRSSDLKSAASALVTARFGFGGHSPYAPDLVLVNEFVIDEFSDLVVQQAARLFSKASSTGKSGEKRQKVLSDAELKEDGTQVVVTGHSGTIMKVQKRQSKLLQRKFTEAVLVLHSFSSLDDAIDFTNKSGSTLLASYIFANPPSAKYLSQFVDSYLSLVNQILPELLVGPATPLNHTPSPSPSRFTKDMFTVPRPAYISTPSASKALTTALASAVSTKELEELDSMAMKELPPTGQKPGGQIGFFEQGILTGLATILIPTLVGTAVLAGFGIRGLVRYVRR